MQPSSSAPTSKIRCSSIACDSVSRTRAGASTSPWNSAREIDCEHATCRMSDAILSQAQLGQVPRPEHPRPSPTAGKVMTSKRLSVYLLCFVLAVGTAAYLIHSAATAPTQPDPAASARTPLPPPTNIDLQMLVDQYLHNKLGILGTIVQVDLRENHLYANAHLRHGCFPFHMSLGGTALIPRHHAGIKAERSLPQGGRPRWRWRTLSGITARPTPEVRAGKRVLPCAS